MKRDGAARKQTVKETSGEIAKVVYLDLSHTISDGDYPYPGDPPTVIKQWATLEADHYRLKQICLASHSGTHMDSPSHLVAKGRCLDTFELSAFFHQAFVVDARGVQCIGKELVSVIPPDSSAVLFFTGWQDRWNSEAYFEDPPLLTAEATTFLLERGIRLFGFDSSSCDSSTDESLPIHHLIFSYDGLILENLANLERVVGRTVSLVALPLPVQESDGAPTRVIVSYEEQMTVNQL